MARNVEIKARVDSLARIAERAAAIADQGPIPLTQDDTFFSCPNGRLKLRKLADDAGDLIFYQRGDITGPKTSHYLISRTHEPDQMLVVLSAALPTIGRVRKQRTLYLVGRTRIHLDQVEGLGDFIELEVVLRDGEDEQQGVEEAHALLRTLKVDTSKLLPGAYLDLLSSR